MTKSRLPPILRIAQSPGEAWSEVIGPWFEKTLPASWDETLPVVVAVPSRSHANALKARLLERGHSCLGLHFLTPAGLRDLLGPNSSPPPPPHLRLLLAVAAEEIASNESDHLAARAIARSPDNLLRTLDQLEAAGWDFDDLEFTSFRPIVRRFREHLRGCSFQLPAQIDRSLDQEAKARPPSISHLLIAGFDGAHWPLWFLLQAAVQAAEKSTVVLQDRREEAPDLDETWIGSWEQLYGAAQPIATSARHSETLFPELFETGLFQPHTAKPSLQKHFLVGRTVSEQARAIAALSEAFVASSSAKRIGILFPAAGALPRTVSALLSEAKIAHYDGIAHLAPGPLEDDAWPAWLELQETPRLRILLRFLRASPAACDFFSGLGLEKIEDVLQRANRSLLIDDLPLLRAWCASGSQQKHADKILAGLEAIRFLPENATLSDFLAETLAIFESLQWHDRARHLQQTSAGWSARLPATFSRATYLRWLAGISTSVLPERDRDADHPYARVQLLFYPQAEGQTWSHLIFAGLNENSWPPRTSESGFLEDREIAAFNADIRKLNRRALRQGNQGEGHSVVASGKTFCLGPAEHRGLVERQFQNLCESVTIAIGASASLIEETAPERLANPSEFFTRLYLETQAEAPGQSTMAALETETAEWLRRYREKSSAVPVSNDVPQTAIAYHARNTPEVKFGEYEFALREPLSREITLSATDCERIIRAPALVWLKKFLGVEARQDEFANWNIAIGQWVHDWLRHVAQSDGEFVQRPTAQDVRSRVQKAARQFREEVTALHGRALPDWWISGWNQAAFIADALAETITTTEGWSHFATEWTLPPSLIRVSETEQFAIRGRIDLIIAREPGADKGFPFQDTWIIDYKTGRRTSLAPGRKSADKAVDDFRTKLLDGKGVQLAIYALALHELGSRDVGISLLTRELDLDRAQVAFPVIEAQREIWAEFARLSRSGAFGMRGPLRAEFQFQNDYPLATLGFDPDFLEEKWSATHPGLPKIEKRP